MVPCVSSPGESASDQALAETTTPARRAVNLSRAHYDRIRMPEASKNGLSLEGGEWRRRRIFARRMWGRFEPRGSDSVG